MIGAATARRAAGFLSARYPAPCIVAFLLAVLSAGTGAAGEPAALPHGFVYLDAVIPDIRLDLRYCTDHNFVGERIDGYLAPRAILSRAAAAALAQVQAELRQEGLTPRRAAAAD
jgi:D-alanyl-D-alanine dipeptidase